MTFANAAGLIRLLLQQSDRHPIRAVGAADLQPYDPRLVRSLRNLGILTEREDLRDDGATVLQVVDEALVAIDPETGACERHHDALDVQTFDIDLAAICRAIREQSGLEGPGPTPISTRVWRLGRSLRHGRVAEICLVRRLREETAQEIVDHVRGAIDTGSSVALISLGRCDLPNVAVVTQILIFPIFGLHTTLAQNLKMGAIFTIMSIARSFALRRVFEAIRMRSYR